MVSVPPRASTNGSGRPPAERVAEALARRLPGYWGGFWYEDDGRAVFALTEGAQRVADELRPLFEALRGKVRLRVVTVPYTERSLRAVQDRVGELFRDSGSVSAYGYRPEHNAVVVWTAEPDHPALAEAVRLFADRVRIEVRPRGSFRSFAGRPGLEEVRSPG